jgi:hypothetical protein
MPTPTCVHCHTPMTFLGRKMFHEGTRWGALGDLFELLVNKVSLDVYYCPSCGKVEFYVPPNTDPRPKASAGEAAELQRVRRLMAQYTDESRRKPEPNN